MWEDMYQQGGHNNIAPYTEIFSFLARNCGHDAHGKKLLEIGCGVANNLVFAKWAFGFDVYGIDQSEAAIELAVKRFEKHGLSFEYLQKGSIDSLDFDNAFFDVVIDRAAIQHNTYSDAKKIAVEVHRVLKPGGLFYSGLSSDCHPLFEEGEHLGNGDYREKAIGVWHFFSKSEILEIFSDFEVLKWYHTMRQDLPSNKIVFGVYHLEMRKCMIP